MRVYILKIDYYDELSHECGASDILNVYSDKKECIKELIKHLDGEIRDKHIIEDNKTIKEVEENIKELISNNMTIRFCGYMTKYDYEQGNSDFEYIIEEREVIQQEDFK